MIALVKLLINGQEARKERSFLLGVVLGNQATQVIALKRLHSDFNKLSLKYRSKKKTSGALSLWMKE